MPFDLRSSPAPTYNALADPHANYYFVSSAAKQRLKDLKRSLRRERQQKSSDEKQMLKLIKEKIRFKFPKIQLPLVNQQQLSAIIANKHHSQQVFHQESDYSREGTSSRRDRHLEGLYGEEEKERLRTDAKKSISWNKAEQMRRSINHSDFVQFLAERKSQLL